MYQAVWEESDSGEDPALHSSLFQSTWWRTGFTVLHCFPELQFAYHTEVDHPQILQTE